ncbi:ASCH domain-containing protein [Saccharothrix carnea]|uniref:ASCH domain-containing protein n=1 Tax=Saccharothrix carnea TaxID=1280637 RepID=UPI0015E6F94D|nr:ASCH domain-containing protein [Saccharothrix carnea]
MPESVRRPLLMSLRPRFAEAILQGSKTVELRRTRVSAAADTTIIIYASTPVMSVVGVATLAKVDTAAPGTLWRRYRHRLGLTRSEFDDYLAGVDAATCLSITNPRTLDEPLKLADLRAQADFQPPQSYRYLAPHDPDMLHSLTENVQVGPTPLEVGRR